MPLRPILWLLLAAPAAVLLAQAGLADADRDALAAASGTWAGRFLVAALALGPLAALLPTSRGVAWLRRQRRAFGLAAFGTAVVHLALYVGAMDFALPAMLAEAGAPGIWTGWAALLLLAPLAATSNDAAMRALGRNWKRLQRLAYPAALLTLLHWAWVHNGLDRALLWFVPLLMLAAARWWIRRPAPAR